MRGPAVEADVEQLGAEVLGVLGLPVVDGRPAVLRARRHVVAVVVEAAVALHAVGDEWLDDLVRLEQFGLSPLQLHGVPSQSRCIQECIHRKLLPAPERRAALIQAAKDAFAERGFAATSMDDVAAAAGVSRLIVYRHFESKEDLYDVVVAEAAAMLVDALHAVRATPPGTRRCGALLDGRARRSATASRCCGNTPRASRSSRRTPTGSARRRSSSSATLLTTRGRRRRAPGLGGGHVAELRHRRGDALGRTRTGIERDDEFLALMAESVPPMIRAWAALEATR